jgi:hypothetical protein
VHQSLEGPLQTSCFLCWSEFQDDYQHVLKDLQMIIPGQFGFNCPSCLSEKTFWNIFPIGSNVKLSPTVAAILNFISKQKTQSLLYFFCSGMKFKMAATAWLSLTLDPMGKMFQNASSLKQLGQLKPNCPGKIIGRSSHNLCRGPSNDHSWAVWFQLSKWFRRRSVLKHFSHPMLN